MKSSEANVAIDPHPTFTVAQSDHSKGALPILADARHLWHIMPIAVTSQGMGMPTRNVVLTDYQAALVEQLVASGRYQNASEVLREGLRLIESREAEDKARLKALREAARIGIGDMDEGRFRSFTSPNAIHSHLNGNANEVILGKVSESSAK